MTRIIFVAALGTAISALSPPAMARQTVALPGVVGPTGELSGVDTTGPGLLSVGNQNINTSNDGGGAITTDAADTANVLFSNSSIVTGFVGTVGSTFLDISAGATGETVTFDGHVYSTTFSLSGTGVVNFNQGFTSNSGSTMDFAGDGFINVGAGQTVKAAITNTAGAHTGTLTLNNNSILDGAVGAASGLKEIRVVGGNALITGQANSAIYTLNANTLNVAGALDIPVAGVINTTILSNLTYGQIVPVGFATIGNNLQINVTVAGPIDSGTNFNIVDATSGTTGSVVIVTPTSNSLRYLFSAAPTVTGRVIITTTGVPLADIVAPSDIPAASGIAPVVDLLPVDSDTLPLLTAITLLPTAPAIADALAQLNPSTSNLEAPHVAHRVTQLFHGRVASHLEQSQTAQTACGRDSQPNDGKKVKVENASACEASDMRAHWWATGIGSWGEQDNARGYEGYNSRIGGMMIAYETPLGSSDSLRAGFGVGYARSSLDANTYDTESDINSYQAIAYLGYAPGAWFVNGSLSYGLDDYSGSRHVVIPGYDGTAQSDFRGDQLTAFATTGYNFRIGDGKTIVTPIASLQYTHLNIDGYTETGASAIDLRVDNQSYNFVQSGLGGKIARNIPLGDSKTLRPELHTNWLHSFGNTKMSNNASFTAGGPGFTASSMAPERDMYEVGAGITLAGNTAWSLEAVYDYQWQSEQYSAHQAMITFAMPL